MAGRYDARAHLRWLIQLDEFEEACGCLLQDIEPDRPLKPRVAYGWNHIPDDEASDRQATRKLRAARRRIASVLPVNMRCLTETICLVGPYHGQLEAFADKIVIAPTRSLTPEESGRLQAAIRRRLGRRPAANDRKTITRLLERINPPSACRLKPDLVQAPAGPVNVSASHMYLHGRVVAVASQPDHPAIGQLWPNGHIEMALPPLPARTADESAFHVSPSVDGDSE